MRTFRKITVVPHGLRGDLQVDLLDGGIGMDGVDTESVVVTGEAAMRLAPLIDSPKPDPAANRPGKAQRNHPDTSKRAALEVAPRSGTQRWHILEAIREEVRVANNRMGLTDEEIAAKTGLDLNTVRPRRLELLEGKHIYETPARRKTAKGGHAIVWGPR